MKHGRCVIRVGMSFVRSMRGKRGCRRVTLSGLSDAKVYANRKKALEAVDSCRGTPWPAHMDVIPLNEAPSEAKET